MGVVVRGEARLPGSQVAEGSHVPQWDGREPCSRQGPVRLIGPAWNQEVTHLPDWCRRDSSNSINLNGNVLA